MLLTVMAGLVAAERGPYLAAIGILVLLSGCRFDYPLAGAVEETDPAAAGFWQAEDGGEQIEVRAGADGVYRISVPIGSGILEFDAQVLERGGMTLLQTKLLGTLQQDGTRKPASGKLWWIAAIERRDDEVVLHGPDADFGKNGFASAEAFDAAMGKAIRDRVLFAVNEPFTYRKVDGRTRAGAGRHVVADDEASAKNSPAPRRGSVAECGTRRCIVLKDGRLLFNTRSGKAWFFEDGALAPRELWPNGR